MRINPVNINNAKPVSFGEGTLNNLTPNMAILALQNPNAKIDFTNDQNRAMRADMVQSSNWLSAVYAKFSRTYNILFSPNYERGHRTQQHISYMA